MNEDQAIGEDQLAELQRLQRVMRDAAPPARDDDNPREEADDPSMGAAMAAARAAARNSKAAKAEAKARRKAAVQKAKAKRKADKANSKANSKAKSKAQQAPAAEATIEGEQAGGDSTGAVVTDDQGLVAPRPPPPPPPLPVAAAAAAAAAAAPAAVAAAAAAAPSHLRSTPTSRPPPPPSQSPPPPPPPPMCTQHMMLMCGPNGVLDTGEAATDGGNGAVETSRLRASISGASGDLEQRVASAVGDAPVGSSPHRPSSLSGAAPPRGAPRRRLSATHGSGDDFVRDATGTDCIGMYVPLSAAELHLHACSREHGRTRGVLEVLRALRARAAAPVPANGHESQPQWRGPGSASHYPVYQLWVPRQEVAPGHDDRSKARAWGKTRSTSSDGAANSVSRLGGRVGVNRFACLDSSGRWQIVRVGNDRSVAVMWRSPDASVLDRLRSEGAVGTSGSLGLRVRFLLLNVPTPSDPSLARGCPLTQHEAGRGHHLPRMRQSTQPALVTPSLSCLRSFSQLVRIENTEQRVDEC